MRSRAHRLDGEIARQRHRAGEMIDQPCLPRGALNPRHARAAQSRIAFQRGRDRPRHFRWPLRSRHLASTAASSIAIPAPWAANGSMAWAASPNSAIAPSVHSPPSGTVNSAHLRQPSTAPIIIRAGPGQRDDANAFLISPISPGALQPGLFQVSRHHGDDVDLARARDRIGDEMRVRSHPELDPARGIFARQLRGIERSAPGDQPGELRLQIPETDDAARSTRCRRRRSAPAPVPAGASMPLRWTTVSPLAWVTTSSNWQPSRNSISGCSLTCGLQRRLQIGAMHHPIGRAGARGRGFAERQAADFAAAARAHQADAVGRDRARRKPRLQAEVDQDAAGIGRELQAGAGFLQPFGLFQNDDAKALCRKRQRGRQSPDPGTSDEDGARRRHRPIRRPCPSPRIRAAGLRRRRGRRRSGTASSNRGR